MGSRAAARAKRQARRKKVALGQATDVCAAENVSGSETATLAFTPSDLPQSTALPELAANLSPKQQMAVAALVLGGNVTHTAAEIGVDRRTIQRWMKDDPQFHDVLEAMRSELVVCARQNLLLLAECSADVVETLFAEKPCPRLALAFMRGLGALGPAASAAIYHAPHVQMDVQTEPAETQNANRAESATSAAAAEKTTAPPAAARFKPAGDVPPLSPPQQTVLESLSQGESIRVSAAMAQVSEAEVRHWLHSNVEFCLQLGELQFERVNTLRGKLFKLLHQALDILRTAIFSRNGRIALALLRGLGMLK